MRKTVSPNVAIAVIIVVLVVVGYFFYKKVRGPGKIIMTPQGAVDARTGELLQPRGGRRGGRGGRAGAEGEEARQPGRRGRR